MKTPVVLSTKVISTSVLATTLLVTGLARAETPAPKPKTETCVQIIQIDHTKILDDQNILFYMKDRKIYKNHLPNRCAGLKAADTFRYRTSQSQLCNVDIITVLNRTGGDFMPGPSCGLGVFEPYTPPPKEEKQAAQPTQPAATPANEPDPDED